MHKCRESVTLVHKGNIMKFTEGAFRDWGYELAKEKFPDVVVTEADVGKNGRETRADAVIIKDRIADSMFQQLLLTAVGVFRNRDAESQRRLPVRRCRCSGGRPRYSSGRQRW